MAERPPHGWNEIPEGFAPVAEPDPGWRTAGHPDVFCAKKAPWGKPCPGRGVVMWKFNLEPVCERHSHGHWIEDGQVMHWVMRKVDVPCA